MKIVEVISDTNVGGAGILLLSRMRNRDRDRFSYHVILPRGSALKERFVALGVVTWEVDACRDRSFSLRGIPQYLSLLRYLTPDLVNCHGCLSCRVAAMLCRIPCRVYTRHCAYPPPAWQRIFPGKQLLGWAQGLLSHHTIAVAYAAREDLLQTGTDPKRVTVIINGAERQPRLSAEEKEALREALGIPRGTTVVGICARLEPCKDHLCFLRAAKRLVEKGGDYRFLVVGDGSLASSLKAWCRDHKLERHVIFTGFVKDVSPYFNLMDLNVNCSVGTETSSLALSEGMSLGIPAIVSDYGGNPYMVRHGENGLVYPQGRDDLLAEAIERLTWDRDLYGRLSQNALRRYREELNAETMTKKTEKLYQELFRSVKN